MVLIELRTIPKSKYGRSLAPAFYARISQSFFLLCLLYLWMLPASPSSLYSYSLRYRLTRHKLSPSPPHPSGLARVRQ